MRCDLLDIFEVEEAMAGITEVYHCAAIVSFDPKMRDAMIHFNTESTVNIVNQALEQGIRKLVHVSSVAAIGRTGDALKEITEEEEWGESKYNSAYAISKYMAETEVWRAIGEGLNAVIINPGIILGAGDWNTGSAQLMKVADKEFPFYTQGVNGWVDAVDVVRIMTLLMAADTEAERFIVCAGNIPYRDIFTMMATALQKRPPRYLANSFVTGMVWRWSTLQQRLTGRHPVITKETAASAQGFSYYNNQKLLQAFPAFRYTAIKATIENMARSYRDNGKKESQVNLK